MPGVTEPYLYFGMWKACFAWHVEGMFGRNPLFSARVLSGLFFLGIFGHESIRLVLLSPSRPLFYIRCRTIFSIVNVLHFYHLWANFVRPELSVWFFRLCGDVCWLRRECRLLPAGTYFSSFRSYLSDMDLYSINLLHFGDAKYWYGVPASEAAKLERVAQVRLSRFSPTNRSIFPFKRLSSYFHLF